TTLGNLVLLCRRHHRAVHEGGVSVCMDVNQQVVFFTPKGRALWGAPPVNPEPGRPRAMGGVQAEPEGMGKGGPSAGRGVGPGRDGEGGKTSGAAGELRPPTIDAAAAIPRFKRDSAIPWEVEARVWEVLDPV
ncbi:MAG: HNH endonuclease signature motif containing protein, partial [Gemmatimonadota bacterium]